jgi:predicted DsbA family dithiol-disulfide isomerase
LNRISPESGVVMSLAVDVISDLTCPWCYIGMKRLEKAIAAFDENQKVRVRWLPFQLSPTMPKEGISRKEYRVRSRGTVSTVSRRRRSVLHHQQ